jgi:hypothetical protein
MVAIDWGAATKILCYTCVYRELCSG